MSRVEIIGFPQSTYVRVVRMACEEKGIPYDLIPVRPHAPEAEAIHPLGKVPAMRHGDLTLCESKAIVSYLDRVFDGPKLIPEDPRRAAEVEQWVSLVNTAIDPVMVRQYLLAYVFPKSPDGKPDRAVIDAALPQMEKQAGILDRAVAGGHLVGDSFTLADINLMPLLFYVRQTPEGGPMVRAATQLEAYYNRHAQRPSFANTMPPPPPGK